MAALALLGKMPDSSVEVASVIAICLGTMVAAYGEVHLTAIGLFCVVWVPRISRRSAGGGYRALRADTADQYAQTPTINELVGSYLKPGQPARIFGDQPASAERLYVESEALEQYTAATTGDEGVLERSYQQIVVYEATPWQSKK